MQKIGPKKPDADFFLLLGKGSHLATPDNGYKHLHLTKGVASVSQTSIQKGTETIVLERDKFYVLKKQKEFTIKVSAPAEITFSIHSPIKTDPGPGSGEVRIDPDKDQE